MWSVNAPLLQLGGAMTPSHAVIQTPEQLQELTASFAHATATESEQHDDNNRRHCVRMDATVDKTISRATLGQFFAEALSVNGSQSGVLPLTQPVGNFSMRAIRVLAVHKDSMTPQRFACLLSALPHTRSLHTLRLEEANRSFPWKLKKLELSWLAYALFHPETRASSWRKLVVGNCKLVGDVMGVLQQMGDEKSHSELLSAANLATLMGVERQEKKRKRCDGATPTPPSHQAPHQLRLACIKKDTVIRVGSGGNAVPLVTIQNTVELEMCAFRSEVWHCVLVPGFGFGWVHQGDVLEEKPWELELPNARGCSPLTHLELGYPITMAKVLLILAATGGSLESLVLESFGLPSSVLDDVSRLCPGLKSLGIKSSRVSLSRTSLQRYFSQPTTHHLRSLALSWSVCNHTALLEILSNSEAYTAIPSLKELRLDKAHYVGQLAAMLDANQTLERLAIDQWSGSDASQLLKHHGEVLPSARASITFLSVIAQLSKQNGGRVFERIGRDLITLIVKFAAVQREVSILNAPRFRG